jgi:hypothetical protein
MLLAVSSISVPGDQVTDFSCTLDGMDRSAARQQPGDMGCAYGHEAPEHWGEER